MVMVYMGSLCTFNFSVNLNSSKKIMSTNLKNHLAKKRKEKVVWYMTLTLQISDRIAIDSKIEFYS